MTLSLNRIRALAVAGLAATWAFGAQALEVKFDPVAPNVYAYVGDIEGRTYENEALNANIGLVVTPAGALLIDPGASFQSARQIAEAAKKVTTQPIKWVINTGGQDHRWLGNGYFKAQGAEIMAHAHAEADMKARGPEHLKANAPVLKEKMDGTELVLPTRWLKDANTKLELGGTVIEVVHRNGGHTPGDSMVWLPQSGVVFTGDVVYVDRILGLHPVSKTKTWMESFEALEALNPKVVVPGHGRVTTLAQAQKDTGNLLKAMRAHMGKAVEAGTDMSAAIKSFDAAPYQHLKHVDVWLPQIANRTYLDMEME
jgi:glyoxylase-like metal-dependent hydrolase (beta-lactamase superfamily II)